MTKEEAIEQLLEAANEWKKHMGSLYKDENGDAERFADKIGGKKIVSVVKTFFPKLFSNIELCLDRENRLIEAIDDLNNIIEQKKSAEIRKLLEDLEE
jgi:hypothetical protein